MRENDTRADQRERSRAGLPRSRREIERRKEQCGDNRREYRAEGYEKDHSNSET